MKDFITELIKVAKKAKMKPMEYFETKFVPYFEEQNVTQFIDFAKKQLNVRFVADGETTHIAEQIERIISRLPAKEKSVGRR